MENFSTNEFAPEAGTTEAKVNQLHQLRGKYKGESRESQRIRLLHALRLFPISTLEARKHLDIMHPAGRVMELREEGNDIAMYRSHEETDSGIRHNVGMYVLEREIAL